MMGTLMFFLTISTIMNPARAQKNGFVNSIVAFETLSCYKYFKCQQESTGVIQSLGSINNKYYWINVRVWERRRITTELAKSQLTQTVM